MIDLDREPATRHPHRAHCNDCAAAVFVYSVSFIPEPYVLCEPCTRQATGVPTCRYCRGVIVRSEGGWVHENRMYKHSVVPAGEDQL